MALAHGTGASTKASLLTQIQAALLIIATTVWVQHQRGELHLLATTVWVQHQSGETLSTQSVHAPDGAAN